MRDFFWNAEAGTPRIGRLAGTAALLVVVLWLAFASTVVIGTGEIAVMTRFGRVTGQELGEGFHIKNPLDHANKYDVKVQKEEAKAAAASKDLQDVQATLVVNYALAPGEVSDIHQNVGTLYREKLVDPAIQEVFKASTAGYDATSLITKRSEVKENAVSLLRERLDDFGIRVVDLSITNFAFSAEFTQAIEAKQVAQQNAERARFNLDASKIDAQAQEVQAATLSDLFLRKLFLEKWNGELPRVMGSDESGFLFDLREEAEAGR
jgi:regulator of protease activity HflC (stomatin/prohibitin superfamily)